MVTILPATDQGSALRRPAPALLRGWRRKRAPSPSRFALSREGLSARRRSVALGLVSRHQAQTLAAPLEVLQALRRQVRAADADAHADGAAHELGFAFLDFDAQPVGRFAADRIFMRSGRGLMDEIFARREPVDDRAILVDAAADQHA